MTRFTIKAEAPIEGKGNNETDLEKEANEWASKELIEQGSWKLFNARCSFSASAVKEFARQQGIAPGIVVGRLQFDGLVGFSHLNHLKVRYKWMED